MFFEQNNDMINFTRLFQGVPFFITICNCNYLNMPSFFFTFFKNLFMFGCLCCIFLYVPIFFSSWIFVVVIMVKNMY